MSMTRKTAAELRKLREIVRVELADRNCTLCGEALLDSNGWVKIGDTAASGVKEKLTYHHKDHNHQNNRKNNLQLVHTTCHKQYHANYHWKTAWKKKRVMDFAKNRKAIRRAA